MSKPWEKVQRRMQERATGERRRRHGVRRYLLADLEALIQARRARAGTLRQVVEDVRGREENLKRGARRQTQAKLAGQIPAEEAYRATVAEMAATLESSNVEGARAALRSLIGTVSVSRTPGGSMAGWE